MLQWTQILNPLVYVIINRCAKCGCYTTNILFFVLFSRNSLMDMSMNDQCEDTIIRTFDIR